MSEQTFFNEGNILVTNSRFVTPAKMYAMSGVTSVGVHGVGPARGGPVGLLLFGMLLCAPDDSRVVGVLMLVAAIAWFVMQKTTWYVTLTSASGQVQALESTDQGYIQRVTDAISQAIVHRG